jgi:hypothetical protein
MLFGLVARLLPTAGPERELVHASPSSSSPRRVRGQLVNLVRAVAGFLLSFPVTLVRLVVGAMSPIRRVCCATEGAASRLAKYFFAAASAASDPARCSVRDGFNDGREQHGNSYAASRPLDSDERQIGPGLGGNGARPRPAIGPAGRLGAPDLDARSIDFALSPLMGGAR